MEQQGEGPHRCRDCTHPESCHPEAAHSVSTTGRTVDDIIKNFRPELTKLRQVATDEDARRETNSGFRASEDDIDDEQESKKLKKRKAAGRGGSTKFKVLWSSVVRGNI